MILSNLYVYHTFLELFKILKTHVPVSLHSLYNQSHRDTNLKLKLPKLVLEISRNNFVFKSSSIWNYLITNIFEKNVPGKDGIVVRGSVINR